MESMRQATIAARGAANALHTVTAICVNLAPREGVLADKHRAARLQLIEDVISIERQVFLLKQRAEALFGKLAESRPVVDA